MVIPILSIIAALAVIVAIFGSISLLYLAVVAVAIGLFAYRAAKYKRQASFPAQDTMEFVVAGGRLVRVLDNIRDYFYHPGESDYATKVGVRKQDPIDQTKFSWELQPVTVRVTEAIIPQVGVYKPPTHVKALRYWLRKKFGFYWVSTFYPAIKVHSFPVVKTRPREGYQASAQRNLTQWLEIDQEPQDVDFLLWRIPRAIIVPDIEFVDQLKASLGIVVTFQVVIPRIPVFTYNKRFFALLESAIRGAVLDYARPMKFVDFVAKMKTGPQSDFFPAVVSQLNAPNPVVGGSSSPSLPGGLIKDLGVEAIGAVIELIQPEENKQVTDALQAQEIARLKGEAGVIAATKAAEARIITANAEAAAKIVIGKAEADILKEKVAGAGAAFTIADQHIQRVAALKDTNVTTYLEGGANASVMVPAGGPPPKP